MSEKKLPFKDCARPSKKRPMNLDNNPTISELKKLLIDFAYDNGDKIKFRLETFQQGNGYVGYYAANDDDWVSRIYNVLLKIWHSNYHGYCDIF